MTMLAALALLSLLAAQPAAPDPDSPPPPAPPPASSPPSATAEPPSIDSILEQEPLTEDARQAAVRGAFDAAQARRGSLDGRWRLSGGGGEVLYIFQFTDPGQTPDPRSTTPSVPVIEGAWRDPRRAGSADGSGFLASVQREGAALTVRFPDPDSAHFRSVTLHARASGDWAGQLEGAGAPQSVVMTRF